MGIEKAITISDFPENGIFLEDDPLEVLKEILSYGILQGNLLTIHTDLKWLDQPFLDNYSKIFPWHMKDSQRSLMTPEISNSKYEFSYYNRIHNYFENDQLSYSISQLRVSKNTRPIVTWDPRDDMLSSKLIPCLMIIQFHISNNKEPPTTSQHQLDMSVVFRSRDIIRRLIPNWNALYQLQKYTADQIGAEVGELNDISLRWFYKENDLKKIKEIL